LFRFVGLSAVFALVAPRGQHPSPVFWCIFALVSFPFLVPSVAVRILIELGLARSAYFFSRISPPLSGSRNLLASAVLNGVLGLANQAHPAQRDMEFFESLLTRLEDPPGDFLVAYAMIAVLRANFDRAIPLMHAAAQFFWISRNARIQAMHFLTRCALAQ